MARKNLQIPVEDQAPRDDTEARRKTPRSTLNLTIRPDEHKAFKEWAVRHDFTMSDAFREAFELLKQKYGR